MSDDLFFEGEEPVEEVKKPAPKKKPASAPAKARPKGASPKKGGPAPKGKPSANKRPAPVVREAAFEFTSMVVILIAVIALLVGFLAGLLAANTLLTPTVNQAPPVQQQMSPQDGMGGMGGGMGGMGGGMAPTLDDDQMMGEMPAGHPPIDEEGNVVMPDEAGAAEADAPVEEDSDY